MSASANYREVWTPTTIRYNNYDPTIDGVVKDTIKGFDAFRTYSFGVSVGTTVYGTVNFKPEKRIQSVRHTIRPSVSFGTAPSFDRYYDEYIDDIDGGIRQYTRFEGGLYGAPSLGKSKSMGISLANNFEAKVKSRDSTETELKKVQLIKTLNLSTSYNFLADSFKWSTVRASTGVDLFNKKMAINIAATLDPYALDDNNVRIDEFNIKNGTLFRVTRASLNTGYKFSSKDFGKNKDKKEDEEEEEEEEIDYFNERTSGGGRDDDLFGANISKTREEEEEEATKYPSYRTEVPWNINFTYSLSYNNNRKQNDFSNNSLMFSGDIDLTPKWSIGGSSGFDFKNHGFTYTQLRFNRDLDSWRLDFSWVPFSSRASWNFFIGIKSGMLSDIKYEKNREPDRRLR